MLSDFEGLRVFNAEWKESNPFRAEFIAFDLDTYLSDFERLWWLSREQTAGGRLDAEAEKVGKKTRRLPVSQHLFDDLKAWRPACIKDLRGFNPLFRRPGGRGRAAHPQPVDLHPDSRRPPGRAKTPARPGA